jgi:serine/threonine protein kinase
MNSQIGTGSFATVFANPEGGVVKRIHHYADIEARMLLGELAVLRYIQHPHLVHAMVPSVAVEGSDLLLFVEDGGQDLFQYLHSCPEGDPLQLSLRLVQHLLTGVEYLHRHAILHRDIKPANLLVRAGPPGLLLQLCDFGMACSVDEGQSDHRERHVVTRWYRPPEVELGLPYGRPLDMWSVGCTVAELLRSLFQRAQPRPLFEGTHGNFSPNPRKPTWGGQFATMQRDLPALYNEFAVPFPHDAGLTHPTVAVAPQLVGVPPLLVTALVLPLLHPAPAARLTAAQALERMPPLAPAPEPAQAPAPEPALQQWLGQTEEEAAATLHRELAPAPPAPPAPPQNSLGGQ